MLVLPKRPAEFSSVLIVQTFEQLAEENLGPVMQRYLRALVVRLRDNTRGYCNSIGLYLEMLDTLRIFRRREEADAVQHAFLAFVDKVILRAQSDEDRLRAEKFVEEVHQFTLAFSGSIKRTEVVH